MGKTYTKKRYRKQLTYSVRGTDYLTARVHLLDSPELWRTDPRTGHVTVRLSFENPDIFSAVLRKHDGDRDATREERMRIVMGKHTNRTTEPLPEKSNTKEPRRYSDKHGTLVGRLQLFRKLGAGVHPCVDCGAMLDWEAPKGPSQIIVRYLDGDKANVAAENVVAVCPRCQKEAVNPQHTKEYLEQRKAEEQRQSAAHAIKVFAERDAIERERDARSQRSFEDSLEDELAAMAPEERAKWTEWWANWQSEQAARAAEEDRRNREFNRRIAETRWDYQRKTRFPQIS